MSACAFAPIQRKLARLDVAVAMVRHCTSASVAQLRTEIRDTLQAISPRVDGSGYATGKAGQQAEWQNNLEVHPAAADSAMAVGGISSCNSDGSVMVSAGKHDRTGHVSMGGDDGEFDADVEVGSSMALGFKGTAFERPVLEAVRAVQTVAASVCGVAIVEARMPLESGSRGPSLSSCCGRGGRGAGG